MLDKRVFQRIAAEAGKQLGATGGEAARAAFFMDMLAKWLYLQKSKLLDITGAGVDIHAIDEAATAFCEYIGDKGPAGFTQAENPERFLPTLRDVARDRVKMYVC
jgi:hypothetical protein